LSRTVELAFVPSPDIRRIDRGVYCIGSPSRRPHVLLEQALAPNETRCVRIALAASDFRVRSDSRRAEFATLKTALAKDLTVTVHDARIETNVLSTQPGEVSLTLVNETDREAMITLEDKNGEQAAVSAKTAILHPSFRDTCRSETIAEGVHLEVSSVSTLVVEPVVQDQLFSSLGDHAMLECARHLEGTLAGHARTCNGTVLPSDLSRLVAIFPTAEEAVQCAVRMMLSDKRGLVVRIACDEGDALAFSHFGLTNFFGQVLTRSKRFLADAPLHGLVLGGRVSTSRAVMQGLREAQIATEFGKSLHGEHRIVLATLPPGLTIRPLVSGISQIPPRK
jgi:hypothetical protein